MVNSTEMNRAIRNVLLVVEGDKEERRLVDVLFNTLIHEAEWKIYTYFRDYGAKPLTKAIAYAVGKIQYVLDNRQMEKTFPYMHSESLSDICWSIPLLRLLDYQIEEYKSNGKIAACGTGPFFVAAWKKSLDGAWKAFFGD